MISSYGIRLFPNAQGNRFCVAKQELYFYFMQGTDINFTKLVRLGDRLREFNFRKLPNTDNHYHVDFTDERGQRIVFILFPDAEGQWRTSTANLPLWVLAAESILGNLIKEEVTQQ